MRKAGYVLQVWLHGSTGEVGGPAAYLPLESCGDIGLGHADEIHLVLLGADVEGTLCLLLIHLLQQNLGHVLQCETNPSLKHSLGGQV